MMTKQLRNISLSMLHFYSYGIVAEDNLENESEIKVFPVEKLYLESGNLNVKNGELNKDEPYVPTTLKIHEKVMGVQANDVEPRFLITDEVMPLDKTKYLYADWLSLNSPNRITPPNICKGEKVIIYRYSNSDKFFWDSLNFELYLRKEDHIINAYSDKPEIIKDNVDKKLNEDLEDTYYIMVSPKTKTMKLHTTDKYNELTSYDITLRTDEGYLEIKDGKNNVIKLDSKEDHFNLHIEGSNSKYDLDIHGDESYVSLKDDKNNSIHLDSKSDTLSTNINKDVNETIGNNKIISLNKIAIKNNTTELISLLSEYVETHMQEQHIGNLGIPTNLTNDFISKYSEIKEKLDSLKV